MIKLDEFYYDNIDIPTPQSVNDIMNLLEPIISTKLLFKIDSMISDIILDSGLSGFKQGIEFSKLFYMSNKNRISIVRTILL